MVASSEYLAAPNKSVSIGDTQIAYRRIGPDSGVPLVMLNHWGANLDNFDPPLVAGLGAHRPIHALDYRGIGNSGGDAPLTVKEMADDMVKAIRALGLTHVDLFGFSLGGFVVQQILVDEPALVRRAILTGTGPAGGEGIENVGPVSWPLILKGMATFIDPKAYLFFDHTKAGKEEAKLFLARLKWRKSGRDKAVGPGAFLRQLKAIKAWGLQAPQPLDTVRQPVLIANGDNDIMVPTVNSYDMAKRFPQAELVIYPNAGHGGIFQYHDDFLAKALAFLAAE